MSGKVLVVDDKQMMRDSVATTLQRAGYQVVAAGDGAAALGLVARHHPSAVITDLKMPEMDGLELLEKLRRGRAAAGGADDGVRDGGRGGDGDEAGGVRLHSEAVRGRSTGADGAAGGGASAAGGGKRGVCGRRCG